jgi:hypothetical protein
MNANRAVKVSTRAASPAPSWPWARSEVALTLVSGEVIVGYFGAHSAIGTDQAHPDIYLEHFQGPPPALGFRSDGVWVSGDRISRIEIRRIGTAQPR